MPNRPFALWRHTAYQNTLPDHSCIKLYVNIQVDWSGGPLNRLWGQILFSFNSDKDRRTDGRIRRKNTAPAVSSSIFVGVERKENLIRNDPDKSEFTKALRCNTQKVYLKIISVLASRTVIAEISYA